MAHRLSCPAACGIFPDQGLNRFPCTGRWIFILCAPREVPVSLSDANMEGPPLALTQPGQHCRPVARRSVRRCFFEEQCQHPQRSVNSSPVRSRKTRAHTHMGLETEGRKAIPDTWASDQFIVEPLQSSSWSTVLICPL